MYKVTMKVRECGAIGFYHPQDFDVNGPHGLDRSAVFAAWQEQYSHGSGHKPEWEPDHIIHFSWIDGIYEACQAEGIPTQSHESDLYIPVTPRTRVLVGHYKHSPNTFINQVEGGLWFDVPFAYTPWWEAKQQLSAKAE